jgi:hypothetical protein
MKKLATFAVLAAAAAVCLAAQEGNPLPAQPVKSSVTQQQLAQELAAFKAGTSPYSMKFNPVAGFKSVRTRAEVTAEYLAARDEVAALGREDSGSAFVARTQAAGRKLAAN